MAGGRESRFPSAPLAVICLGLLRGVIGAQPADVPDEGEKDYIVTDSRMVQELRVTAPEGPLLRLERGAATSLHSLDDVQDVVYTAFNGQTYNMKLFRGRYTALLLRPQDMRPQGVMTDEVRRRFHDALDRIYDAYSTIIGAEPPGSGLVTIAVGVKNCGACCGYTPGRAIEIDDPAALNLPANVLQEGALCANHEMAHNFDLFTSAGYLNGHGHTWTAFFNPIASEWIRLPDLWLGPPIRGALIQSLVDDYYLPYISNHTNTWNRCVLAKECALEFSNVLNAVDFRFFQLHGVDKLPSFFDFLRPYRASHAAPTSWYGREDLHIRSLASAAHANLGCYSDFWRWFASPEARSAMATNYGTTNSYCLDADGDTFSPLAGDCDDSASSIHPEASEVPNGKDNDCNGVVGDVLFERPPGGFAGRVPISIPSRIAGRLEAHSPDGRREPLAFTTRSASPSIRSATYSRQTAATTRFAESIRLAPSRPFRARVLRVARMARPQPPPSVSVG